MTKAPWILTQLKRAGYKLTNSRKEVATWIEGHTGVFSAGEVMKALPDLDRVSIYRTLELFEMLDCIHPVLVQHGEQHYEKHSDAHHHHHAVCKECEKTTCVPCDIERTSVSGFRDIHHTVVFTGLCVACV